MNKNRLFWIIIFLLILAGIFVPRFFDKQTKSSTQPVNTSPAQNSSSKSAPGEMTIRGFNYGFSPKTITVKQGETVKIRLVSDDSPHTFTIDELEVNQEFTWGKDTELTFVASKKGTFQFYCAVPGHKEGGMVGTLIVE